MDSKPHRLETERISLEKPQAETAEHPRQDLGLTKREEIDRKGPRLRGS